MKKHLFILFFIYPVLWITGQNRTQAQERFADRYNITYITMNEGLPHNFVDDVVVFSGYPLPEEGSHVSTVMSSSITTRALPIVS